MSNAECDKLKDARDKIAEVYETKVTTDGYDNGTLDNMHEAIKHLEIAIKTFGGC